MKYIYLSVFFTLMTVGKCVGQVKNSVFLSDILNHCNDSLFTQVINNPQKYRLQIIYTIIDRNNENKPIFSNFYFNVDNDLYFYPASTVKLPISILALEKLNRLSIATLDKNTTMYTDSACCEQTTQYTDFSASNKKPSIAHYIKEALLVSENNPYNRLYEFLGQEYLNKRLWEKQYFDTRIIHRFVPNSIEQNKNTNPIRFVDKHENELYVQPRVLSNLNLDRLKKIEMGKGYYDWNDNLINTPMEFTYKNKLGLENLHNMIKAVMFPDFIAENMRFELSNDDYHFLRQYLSQFPGETNYPKYDRKSYYDTYVKPFFGQEKTLPDSLRIFNKVGWSYGFLTDASYIADFKNKIEFMLSATIYVNEDSIFNDNVYEYKSIALPFLHQLGQIIYEYELTRKREHTPDLSQFKLKYETQRIDDTPTITNDEEW